MNWYKKILTAEKALDGREILAALRYFNIVVHRLGSGSKSVLINLDNGRKASFHVYGHRGEDIKKGTLKSMLKQLGLDKNEFFEYVERGKRRKNINLNAPPEQKDNIKEEPEKIPDWKRGKWFEEQQAFQKEYV